MKNNVRKLRKSKRITQTELAKIIGVSQNTLSYWEQGKYDIDTKSLFKLSKYFDVTIDHILCNDDVSQDTERVESAKSIGEKIKELRNAHNYTQKQMADLIGCSKSALGMYEQSRRSLNPETLVKIATIFNVSVDYLLGINDETQSTEHFESIRSVDKTKRVANDKFYVSNLPKPKFETHAEDLTSAISILGGLLAYHRRSALTITDEFSALNLYSYEKALTTAIISLQKELEQL